jgi:DNA-binding CsgD family transcriptional regulator
MGGQRLRPTPDHAFRTPLTTILGLSEILRTELFGPIGSKRYRDYAADISSSAAELCKFFSGGQSSARGIASPQISKMRRALALPRPVGRSPMPGNVVPSSVLTETAAGELIGSIYDAAIDSDASQHFVERLALHLQAETCSLMSYDRRKNSSVPLCTVAVNSGGNLQSAEDFGALNACLMNELKIVGPGGVWTDEVIVPAKTRVAQRRGGHDMTQPRFGYRIGGLIDRGDAEVTFILAFRTRRRGPFGRDDVELLEQLLPHLRKALNVQRKVRETETECEVLASGFGRVPLALIIVGSDGRPFYFNDRAKDVLKSLDGLALGNDGLCGATAQETGALRKAIEGALAAASRNSDAGGEALLLSRPSGHKPFAALVVPAPTRSVLGFRGRLGPAAAIFVANSEDVNPVNTDALRRFWHLTQCEARVAALVARGMGVEEIAAELEITANTVRTHLKHIYDKTQTTGQVELVRLIVSSPAMLRQG